MTSPTSTNEPAQDGGQGDAPRRKLDPDPKRAYRITLTIADAPGPFASVEGVAQYDVENENECGEVNPATGTRYRMTSNELFVLETVSDHRYEGTVYADLILDEDYYGKGICRWELTDVRAQLRATGATTETEFLPAMRGSEVQSQQSVKKYFWSGYYPRAPKSTNYPDFGDLTLDGVPADRHDEFFTLTISATEAQP